MDSEITVCQKNPTQQEVQHLLAASDAFSMALYPREGRHPVDVEFLASPFVPFFVARLRGKAVGCVALVVSEDRIAELKRMIVLSQRPGDAELVQAC